MSLPEPYEPLAPLGEDPPAWLARDPTGREVEVYLLPGPPPELPEHPHLVRVLEAGPHYLVTERLEGRFPEGGPVEEILRLFRDVCRGLSRLHGKGRCHPHLTFDSLRVAPDGTARLAGPGLPPPASPDLTYAAPEQILTGEPDPRTDLYCLGVCLFQALTGRPPFQAASPHQLVHLHLSAPPPAPSSLREGLPPELDRLVLRLLAKRPQERPGSAASVARELENILGGAAPDPLEGLAPMPLVGRATVLHTLLEEALRPGGTSLLLTAEAGMGRTAVLRALSERLVQEGRRLLHLEPETFPLADLEQAVAELGGSPGTLYTVLRHGGAGEAAHYLRSLLALAEEPTLVVGDDLERMDPTTRQVLLHLARLRPPPARGWILSVAADQAPQDLPGMALAPLDREALAELAAPGAVDWLVAHSGGSPRHLWLLLDYLRSLEGAAPPVPFDLARAAAHQLHRLEDPAREVLQAAAASTEPVSGPELVAATGLLEEQVRAGVEALLRGGLLEPAGASGRPLYRLASPLVREALGGPPAADSLARRVQHLPGNQAARLWVDAAEEVQRKGAFRAARIFWERAESCLEPAAPPELVWRVRFGLGESLASGGQMEEAAARMAGWLERAAPPPPPARRHPALYRAALWSAGAGERTRAGRLARRGLEELGFPARPARVGASLHLSAPLLLEAAELYHLLAELEEGEEAALLVDTAVQFASRTDDPRRLAEYRLLQARILEKLGRLEEARGAVEAALEGYPGEEDPFLRMALLEVRARLAPETAAASLAAAAELAGDWGLLHRRARLLAALGSLEAARELARRLGDRELEGEILHRLEAWEELLAVGRDLGDRKMLLDARVGMAHRALARGEKQEARTHLQEALGEGRRPDLLILLCDVLEDPAERQRTAVEAFEAYGDDLHGQGLAWRAHAEASLDLGQPEVAARSLSEARRLLTGDPEEEARLDRLAREIERRTPPEQPAGYLRVVKATSQTGHDFPVFRRPTSLGRAQDCAVCLLEPEVSRLHAVIDWDEYGPFLVHQSRTNPTLVNGARVKEAVRLRHGDEIVLAGRVVLQWLAVEASTPGG